MRYRGLYVAVLLIAFAASASAQDMRGFVLAVQDASCLEVLVDGRLCEVELGTIRAPVPGQHCGSAARAFVMECCLWRQVAVSEDGLLLPDGRILERELVAAGFARVADETTPSALLDTQRRAAVEHRGIWSSDVAGVTRSRFSYGSYRTDPLLLFILSRH